MMRQRKKWLLFTAAWYLILFLLIPPERRSKLFPLGFWLGFVQAIILTAVTMRKLKLWKLPGDILLAGIPVLVSLSWVPPAMIFAHYYPAARSWLWKTAYIVLFAAGTTFMQYRLRMARMWQNIKWQDIYTFPLALLTHTIMSFSLRFFPPLRNR